MKTKMIALLAGLSLLAFYVTGCSLSGVPVPTPTSTPTPLPTFTTASPPTLTATTSGTPTPAPTPMPSPTHTLAPSLTPSLTPTLAPCPATPGQRPCAADVTVSMGPGQTTTVRIRYLLYLPGDYGKDPNQKWPLILFLHGSGSIGNDLNMLKNISLLAWLETKTDFPFIVVSPQLPGNDPLTSSSTIYQIQYWSPLIDPLNALLDQLPAQYAIDTRRLYLTGLSLGGFGTWEFALRYPQRFAAIVPVAGGYFFQSDAIPSDICTLKDLPVWVFYGGQDTTVQPVQSSSMIKALRDCGGNVRDTFYPDANHSQTWLRAYADPELWQWLLTQETKGDNQ